jgi:hypothetical protein
MTENQRKTKKLIIATVYGGIFVGLLAGIYFMIPRPPEEEPAPAIPIIPPQVLEFESFKSAEDRYDVYAVVQNPNSDYGLRNFQYEFIIRKQDQSTRSIRGTSYLLPGEKKYVVELEQKLNPNESVIDFQMLSETFEWKKLSRFELPLIIAQNITFGLSNKPGEYFTARATISNQSGYNYNTVDVVALLLDEDGQIIGVNRTNIRTVVTSERRDVEFIWSIRTSGEEVKSIQIYPSTNVLNNSEYLRQQTSTDIGDKK